MNKEKRRALEAAGFVFEDAEDFLELTAEERQLARAAARHQPGHPVRGGSSRT